MRTKRPTTASNKAVDWELPQIRLDETHLRGTAGRNAGSRQLQNTVVGVYANDFLRRTNALSYRRDTSPVPQPTSNTRMPGRMPASRRSATGRKGVQLPLIRESVEFVFRIPQRVDGVATGLL